MQLMKDKISIYYWSPFISHVATVKAVLNSAFGFNKYSKKYKISIINVAGEWDQYQHVLRENNINVIQLTESKILNNSNFTGYLKSRLIYIYIFVIAFIPLLKILKKKPPSFFVIHLITPIPLIINYLFDIKTKTILRISGLPQFNFIRIFFWKFVFKKICHITCPTNLTMTALQKIKLVKQEKISVLYDPIISPKEVVKKKREEIKDKNLGKNYYIAIGRLTKQKNFKFLIEVFNEFSKLNNNKLVILGDGEEKSNLNAFINKNQMQNKVFLIGFKKNVFKYLKNSKCFILSSLWEDPGFVLIEAAYMNIPIISSDCENGPLEILYNGNGLLFKSNDKKSLKESLIKFEELKKVNIFRSKVNCKKIANKFSYFKHYKTFSSTLEKIV